MSTPRGIELNENVLLVIVDKLIVVLSNENSDGTVLALGDGLGLDARLNLALKDVVDKCSNGLLGDLLVLIEGILLAVVDVLDSESGELITDEVEVVGMRTESLSVDGSDIDLALVLLGDRPEHSSELIALFLGLGEQVGKGNAGLQFQSRLVLQRNIKRNF